MTTSHLWKLYRLYWVVTQTQQGDNDIFFLIGPASLLKHKSMKHFEQRPYVHACVINASAWPEEKYETDQNYETS